MVVLLRYVMWINIYILCKHSVYNGYDLDASYIIILLNYTKLHGKCRNCVETGR